jgi:hypothetical protein
MLCPIDLDTIAGRMTALTGEGFRDSIEIGSIANEIRRGLKRSARSRSQKIDGSGANTDNEE